MGSIEVAVRLKSNGDYWQAAWKDSMGKVRGKSLGPKKKVSKRQAGVLCRRLERQLGLVPALRDQVKPPTLGRWLATHLRDSTHLAPGTRDVHRMTSRYLLAYASSTGVTGWRMPLTDWGTEMASAFRSALARGDLIHVHRFSKTTEWRTRRDEPLSEATVALHTRNAKRIFGEAVKRYDESFGFRNPFRNLSGVAPKPSKDWRYLDAEEFHKILQACPSDAWRVFLALQRIQGFRRGEALRLQKRHLQHLGQPNTIGYGATSISIYGVITLPGKTVAQKTKQGRTIPILRSDLADLIGTMIEGKPENSLIVPEDALSRGRGNLRRDFIRYIERAGLKPWADLFQVLRRNAETDMANLGLPQYVVSEWIGHQIATSVTYYLPDSLAQNTAQKGGSPITCDWGLFDKSSEGQ